MLFIAILESLDSDPEAPTIQQLEIEADDEADAVFRAVLEARKLVVYRVKSVTPGMTPHADHEQPPS